MLGIDGAVWLALVLSVASVILCVVYGWARWNVGDETASESAIGINEPGETSKPREQA